MKFPDEIAPVIAEIIRAALLRIRGAGWSGDAELCTIEADHVHNLPSLLVNFSPDLLVFYWRTERESFMRAAKGHAVRKGTAADFRAFEKAWMLLEQLVNQESREIDSRIARQPRVPQGTP